MKTKLIYAGAGFAAGIVIIFIVMFSSAQSLMLKEEVSKYNYEESVELFRKTALEHGWQIPTVHDMKLIMEKHNMGSVLPGIVFELCHPDHAYEILKRDAERIVMSMMPCRVAIYEKSDGKVYVSWMNTGLMGSMMKGVVPEVMKAASAESYAIISVLIK